MKIPNVVKFVALAAVMFGAGAGLAVWKKESAYQQMVAAQQAAMPKEMPKEAAPAPATPAQPAEPTTEAGKIIPNAPEMPQPAAAGMTAAPPSAAPVAPEEHHDHAAAAPETPVAGMQAGGPFTLTDQKGNTVTEKSWPEKYKLVFFGFTHCPDTCPATLQKISALMDNYDPTGAKLQPLFITTDPARDTREVMETYMGGYAHILGLTGTKEQIEAAEKAYKVYAAEGEGGAIDHSAFIYLQSPDDQTLAVLSSGLSGEEMMAKIKEKMPAAP
jgi:protein SCO1/2